MPDAKPPPPPARRRPLRRTAIGLLVLVALGAAAHGLAWRWATGALAVGVSDWVTQRRAEGWRIDHGVPERGGWPLVARLSVPAVSLAPPEGPVLDSTRLVLQLALPRLDLLTMLFEGPQALRLGATTIPFAAARLAAELQLEPGAPPRALRVTAQALEALLPEGPVAVRQARLSVTPAAPPLPHGAAAAAEPALLVAFAAADAILPASPLASAFGRRIDAATLDAVLAGPLPPPAPPEVAAMAWRDAGGALEITSLALRWGALAGEARLVLALDRALQPAGTGTLRLDGAAAAIEALARAGLVAPGAARTAQGVVALLARRPPEGGPPRVEMPLALANGTLSAAGLPLARLAPIAWRGAGGR